MTNDSENQEKDLDTIVEPIKYAEIDASKDLLETFSRYVGTRVGVWLEEAVKDNYKIQIMGEREEEGYVPTFTIVYKHGEFTFKCTASDKHNVSKQMSEGISLIFNEGYRDNVVNYISALKQLKESIAKLHLTDKPQKKYDWPEDKELMEKDMRKATVEIEKIAERYK